MDNQIDESYFIRKSKIKNKNKKRHDKIKRYEHVKTLLIREPGQREGGENTIKFINEEINKLKDKINRDTIIYSY